MSLVDTISSPSPPRDHQVINSSFSRENHVPSRLRSKLPNGWVGTRGDNGVICDGLYLRSSPSSNTGEGDTSLRVIRANKSIKISKLIPILNSTRPERHLQDGSSHSSSLSTPSFSRQSSTSSSKDFVYYWELFLISGICSVGFIDKSGEVASGQSNESFVLHVNGDLWVAGVRVPNWTQHFQNGDTIGCGVVVAASNAKYFFTRNGNEINPGTVDCRVSSIQTVLYPCVGVSSSAGTVVRTNFGFNLEHPFLWKGSDNVRIISNIVTAMPPNRPSYDDSSNSDEVYLPPDLIRGHTTGSIRDVPPAVVLAAHRSDSSTNAGVEQQPRRSRQMRRHSELLPGAGDPLLLSKMLDLNDIKELARELRSATSASDAHQGALSQLVDVCRSNLDQLNETVQSAAMGEDSENEYDLGELLTVHEMVTDSIEAAEKKRTVMESNSNSSHDRRDIYSLLCHLRGQKQKRYDAIWGLYHRTKKGRDEEMCHEIISSGGMQSLLTLFKSSSDSIELMMVSALTAVYLLPLLLDDSVVQSSNYVHMGIIECLQFLIQSSIKNTTADIDISPSEIRTASAFAMTNLWFKVLVAKLRSAEIVSASNHISRFGDGSESDQDFFSRRRSSVASWQSDEDVDWSILVDAFTSLSIMAAKSEASRPKNDLNVYYEFALIVESICAVEYARPLAMKEGVIALLLKWLRSGDIDLERPAASSLRNLALTQDNYTAGWVHSELLNEDTAIRFIVRRLESGDSGVRLAMAEIIASLSIAPHTRAGIIEAQGVEYLVQLLGSVDIARDEAIALAAGNALYHMAMGGVASSRGASVSFYQYQTSAKNHCIIDDIIQNGALNTLVSMATGDHRSLRFLSAKILRVISGAYGRGGKEQELCDADVVSALGKILWKDITFVCSSVQNSLASTDTSDLVNDSLSNDFLTSTTIGSTETTIQEIRHVLRGLINILHTSSSLKQSQLMTLPDTQLKACSQLIASNGIESLLWIASMSPDETAKLEMITQEPRFCREIQIGSLETLTSLCPFILSPNLQTLGAAKRAPYVLSALVNILKNELASVSKGMIPVYAYALQGLAYLADCEALKTLVINEFMPHLLDLHRHENRNVSDAATQVGLALGFNVKSGASDAHLLGDKYSLARSGLLQAMVRDEIRQLLRAIWMPALKAAEEDAASTDQSYDASTELGSLFHSLCQDDDSTELRQKVREQFMNLYDCHREHHAPSSQYRSSSLGRTTSLGRKPMKRTIYRSGSYLEDEGHDIFDQQKNATRATTLFDRSTHLMERSSMLAPNFARNAEKCSLTFCTNNFLQCQQYPLNGSEEEKDWMMEHCQSLGAEGFSCSLSSPCLSGRANDLLRVYFPSVLIRDKVIPLCGFRPDASFDFRGLAMPSGRYFSFRREGQLISKECEKNSEQTHCTLSFHNSSFAGEFSESLLEALYLCNAIHGLSFSNDILADESVYEGSELQLPLLARAPSSVTHLAFDNVLSNSAALSLAQILNDEVGDEETVGSSSGSMSGKVSLHALAVINSPHINRSVFTSLVESNGISSPLQFLHILDLSGNLLGDPGSASVLSIALAPSSSIERLDLSRNGIGDGNAVKGVLQECISNDPKLEVLNLSCNNFGDGELASQLAASLADVLAKLISIDLSENNLSGAFLAALGSSLLANRQLVNLNISNNSFSSSSINGFLSRLHNMSKSSRAAQLLFCSLGGNVPSLATSQELVLNELLGANRQRRVSAYLKKQRKAATLESDSDTNALSSVSDNTGDQKSELKMPPPETLTVLFSAPLVWRDGENAYHPIEMLDFKLEKSLLWQCFTEASRNIDLNYDNATTDRLISSMTRGFKCLHFSGHGHPNSLTFEDGSGGIHWFSVEQLKALISGGLEDGEAPFKFVFVSACHSALAGQTFVDCGVPHVVCCQQESQLMDRAALSFTRAFYLALAVGRTLKESFEIGKNAVLSSATVLNPKEEMDKFMLLPLDGNHDVPIFNAEEVPKWPLPRTDGASLKRYVNDSLPSPPQGFLGRETDMYHVLNLVRNRRFVNVAGQTGMGRSSMVAALCHYIDSRKSTLLFDNIYFVKGMLKRTTLGQSSPIISLHNQLVLAGRAHDISEDADLDEVIKEVLVSLKQTKSLLVFDKIETLDGATAQDFHFFLGQIFERTENVHVLVTSNESIGLKSLVGVGESVYNLGPLNFRNTVKLFAFHCPHLHSPRERKDLVEQIAPHHHNRLAEDDEVSVKIKSILGGGIPAKTFAVAYEMTSDEFLEFKRIAYGKGSLMNKNNKPTEQAE